MKKLFALALSLIMLLGALSTLPVMATEATETTGTTETTTTQYTVTATMSELLAGVKDDEAIAFETGKVYSISNLEDLEAFVTLCTNTIDYFAGATVILTQNITMNDGWIASTETVPDEDAVANYKVWTPIDMFKGHFDGCNFTISGFYSPTGANWKGVKYNTAGDTVGGSENANGMFCTVGGTGVVIERLNITNSYFSCALFSGALVGFVHNKLAHEISFNDIHVDAIVKTTNTHGAGGLVGATHSSSRGTAEINFNNCSFNGEVCAATNGAGGMVGIAYAKVKFENCVNKGHITTTSSNSGTTAYAGIMVGGLIGQVNFSSGVFEMINCHNEGKISADNVVTGLAIGGLVGYSAQEVSMENCSNSVDISVPAAQGYLNMGGLIARGNSAISATSCVNSGDIVIERTDKNNTTAISTATIGGLIGQANQTVALNGCANSGNVTLEKSSSTVDNNGSTRSNLGGLVGNIPQKNVNFTDCLSAATVTGTQTNASGFIGWHQMAQFSFERCVFTGSVSSNSYKGVFVGMMGNAASGSVSKIIDCVYNNSVNPIGCYGTPSNMNMTISMTGGTSVTATALAQAGYTGKFEEAGANMSLSSMLDLNAMKNLPSTYDWADLETGWVIEQVNGEGNYIPMPASVAKLVAAESVEKDNGVDYEGVQLKNDGSAVRFVATVDDLNRDMIGFKVIAIKDGQHAEYELEDAKVYEALTYNKQTDTTLGDVETEYYTVDGKYLGAIAFEGLSATGRYIFAVKAFSKTAQTYSYDDTYIVIIEDGAVAASYQK